jgi:alginate O-acetyltransferase complex protein AlgI
VDFAIFAAGLFKKVLIADNLAQFATPVFAHLDAGGSVTATWAWLSTLSYTLQIYFDFSGYSDMAIGLALMFGIRLPVNFRSPYKSLSIIDFWRRWHITLSRFLRDYLYIPLGGNRLGKARRYINLLVTMLLGRGRLRILSWCVTFAAVVIAWVFFRTSTVGGAWRALKGLAGLPPDQNVFVPSGVVRIMDLPVLVGAEMLLLIGATAAAVALICAVALPNVPQIFRYREYRRAPEQGALIHWKPNAIWAMVAALTFAISLFGMWQRMEFLYFQF